MTEEQMKKWFDNHLINKMYSKNTEEFWDYYANTWYSEYAKNRSKVVDGRIELNKSFIDLLDHPNVLEFFSKEGSTISKINPTLPKDLDDLWSKLNKSLNRYDDIKSILDRIKNKYTYLSDILLNATTGNVNGKVFENFCTIANNIEMDMKELDEDLEYSRSIKDHSIRIKFLESMKEKEEV